jgi:hypothetical protein
LTLRFDGRTTCKARIFRVLAISLTLIGFVVSTVGIPVPVPKTPSGDGPRFMCEGHGCGCGSASQCWNDCCCFSKAERLAWAAERDVEVPASLLASNSGRLSARQSSTRDTAASDVETAAQSVTETDRSEVRRSADSKPLLVQVRPGELCVSPTRHSDESFGFALAADSVIADAADSRSCCSHSHQSVPGSRVTRSDKSAADNDLTGDADSTADNDESSVEWYSTIAAQKCRGAVGSLMMLSDPLGEPPVLMTFTPIECSEWLMEFGTLRLASPCWTPPVPPG